MGGNAESESVGSPTESEGSPINDGGAGGVGATNGIGVVSLTTSTTGGKMEVASPDDGGNIPPGPSSAPPEGGPFPPSLPKRMLPSLTTRGATGGG